MIERIFIQIAAYRDPDLKKTIKSCLENARYPENLVFSIAHQFSNEDEWDNLDEYKNDKGFKIISIPREWSKGACWARNQLQQQYSGEEYTLQIDSHHRFVPNWDIELIDMIKGLQKDGYEKPLLTAYAPSFDPEKDPESRINSPWYLYFDRFIPEGPVFFMPGDIVNWKNVKKPVPSRFYSAHFCFTLGQFCIEVQHDPDYYFHGEEISIAARAFTWGYDLFSPHKVILWHEYTRKGRKRHWDDNTRFGELNSKCHKRNRILFGMDGENSESIDFGIYGFGKVRTLEQYEMYSGLSFSNRAVQQEVIDHIYPTLENLKLNKQVWNSRLLPIFKHCIDLAKHQLPEKDYDFLVVAFKDKDNNEVFREDIPKERIPALFKDPDGYIKIWKEFHTTIQPKSWLVWPHSVSKGWCSIIQANLPE